MKNKVVHPPKDLTKGGPGCAKQIIFNSKAKINFEINSCIKYCYIDVDDLVVFRVFTTHLQPSLAPNSR